MTAKDYCSQVCKAKVKAAKANGKKGGRPKKTKQAKRLSKPENKEAQQPSQSEA